MTKKFTIVRCPDCGSTEAGEDGGMYELAHMKCSVCGNHGYYDDYQIKDLWNVDIELADDAHQLPKFVEPDLPWPCSVCRKTPVQGLRSADDDARFAVPESSKVAGVRYCKDCVTLFRFDDVSSVKLSPATSKALQLFGWGEATKHALAALLKRDDFSMADVERALTAESSALLSELRAAVSLLN